MMTAGIEKAFLQVNIREEDKDSTRFLSFRDGTNPEVKDNLMICRFNRVPFGLNCSPFLLAASVKYLLQTATSKVAKKLQQNMYVDNAMMGVNTIEEANEMYQESKKLFASVKFNLREYNSNNQEFLKMIPEEDRAKDEQPTKLLGLVWNTLSDEIQVGGPYQIGMKGPVTKRTVLQQVASIFDPMGFVTPVTLPGKLMIQSLWQDKKQWDDLLTTEQEKQWEKIYDELKTLTSIKLGRYLGIQPHHTEDIHLHVF
ncbi:MAG: hypothetical protein GY696_19550, partial [Gammaproteobacteria bacterium]|nr:hypothetical protein [Gammaproteobacteria bacterium]